MKEYMVRQAKLQGMPLVWLEKEEKKKEEEVLFIK